MIICPSFLSNFSNFLHQNEKKEEKTCKKVKNKISTSELGAQHCWLVKVYNNSVFLNLFQAGLAYYNITKTRGHFLNLN